MENAFYITILKAIVVLFVCHFVIKKCISNQRLLAVPSTSELVDIEQERNDTMKDELLRYANTIALSSDALDQDSSSDDDDDNLKPESIPVPFEGGELPGLQYYSQFDVDQKADNSFPGPITTPRQQVPVEMAAMTEQFPSMNSAAKSFGASAPAEVQGYVSEPLFAEYV